MRPTFEVVHRKLVSLGSVAVALIASGGTAQATPVRSAATPLLLSGSLPTTCPATPDLDGRTFTRRVRHVLPTADLQGAAVILRGLSVHPTPAIAICDPDLAAARQVVGPFSGDAAATLDEDIVGFGARAIGVGPHQFDRSALHVGDQITLPAVGPRAQLDLSVRTPGGARSIRVAPLGAGASVARIAGTATAPTVVVERGGLPPIEQAVKPQPQVSPTVAASIRGRTARFQAAAAPGTIVVVLSNGKGLASNLRIGQTDATGTAPSLPLRGLRSRNRTAEVMFANLALRRLDRRVCRLRWNRGKDRLRSVRCRAKPGSVTASRLLLDARSRSARTTHAPPLGRVEAHARRLATSTVEATLTTVAQSRGWPEYTLSPDVNGDGRPDAIGTDADDGRSTLIVSKDGGWVSLPVRYPIDQHYTLDSIPEVVPDVTGDGRAELRTADGRFVTDAFSGRAPAAVDLRADRTARAGDLDLGGASPTSKERNWLPRGVLDDRTGDGRPEPVLGYGSATAVFASQDVKLGQASRLATPTPLTIGRTFGAEDEDASLDFGDGSALGEPDRSTLARGGRLWTVEAADASATVSGPQQFIVRARDAAGLTTASSTVAVKGPARFIDVDDVSGDTLIGSADAACEPTEILSCAERIDRVSATGAKLATFGEDGIDGAMFVADGPDIDQHADVVAWSGGSDGPDADFAYAPSTASGTLDFGRLETLSTAGRTLKQAGPTVGVVLPDGSRWLGVTVGRMTKRGELTTLALVTARP